MDKVSVIIPTYNGEDFLKESIESVLNQTHKNLEVIILDDCSSDNTRNILKEYEKNSLCRVIYNDFNVGVNVNINKGVYLAKGDFICILGHDDLYPKNKIERQLNYLNENNLDCVYGTYEFIDEKSHIIEDSRQNPQEFIDLLSNNKTKLINILEKAEPGHYMPMSQTALFRAHVLKELNPFMAKVTLDDWPRLVKCVELYKCGCINEVMFYWRKHNNNNSRNMWWNLGVSVQSCLLVSENENNKIDAMSNNFYYGALHFYKTKNYKVALKCFLVSFILNPKRLKYKYIWKSFLKLQIQYYKNFVKKILKLKNIC